MKSSSFKIQFSPSFDGGAGPQRFLVEVTLHEKNMTFNSTVVHQQLPFNTYEYVIKSTQIFDSSCHVLINDVLDLNESSLYMFRIKSMNIYGESPWSMEIPVQTIESIVTSDGE